MHSYNNYDYNTVLKNHYMYNLASYSNNDVEVDIVIDISYFYSHSARRIFLFKLLLQFLVIHDKDKVDSRCKKCKYIGQQ